MHDGVAGNAAVDGPRRRSRRGAHARDGGSRDVRLVRKRDHDLLGAAQRGEPAAQRRAHPVGPVLADDHAGGAEPGPGADLGGVRAEHDDDPVEVRERRQRVLDERPPVELGELLGAAEAAPLAGGED